jgi:hypothetical protein
MQSQYLQPVDPKAEPRPSLLAVDVVQYDPDYRRTDEAGKDYTIRPSTLREDDLFVSPPFTFEAQTDGSHFGMQWTQFDLTGTLEGPEVGERMRIATARMDSVQALHGAGHRLEMSDVRTMMASSGVIDEAVPFPFDFFSPDTPLVLYFEVYHLAYGGDDRTRYVVAYDVERRARQGWRRLFRSEKTEKTTTEMTYTGTQRRTEEFISIDLSTFRQPKTQQLRVTVRVTDTVTGETVSRAQRIQLVGTEEP